MTDKNDLDPTEAFNRALRGKVGLFAEGTPRTRGRKPVVS